MKFPIKFRITVLACAFLCSVPSLLAQQKPQWMPGQIGLNAGILPSPGFTYVNIDENYEAGTFNGPKGNAVPVTGTYNVWAIENLFYFVPDTKFLGGNLGFDIMFPTPATGSLVADINVQGVPNLSAAGGGSGLADLWVQPFTVGWHLKRWDIQVGDAFMIPTGRYSPGASNNVGSGYFGNHLQTGTTYYITKNKGTSANLFTDWEVHGNRQGTNSTFKSPGQAFTDEWGVGQILPLKKDMSKLLQVGVVGYDQWQVTNNGGTVSLGGVILPASLIPSYSVHAIGGQLNYILPAKNFSLFFKGYHEYSASSHTLGNTIVFGGAWTLLIPKPPPPKS
ncbi:MAG: transporter [Candidatus Acidiferrum sp.]